MSTAWNSGYLRNTRIALSGNELYGPSTFKKQPQDPVFQVEKNDMFLEILGIMAFFPPTILKNLSILLI